MDERMVRFVAALRGAGVRVSLAESQDAFAAARALGVKDRSRFRSGLKAALVKQSDHGAAFEELFPLYFGVGSPPMAPAGEGLPAASQQQLRQRLEQISKELRELLQQALAGRPFNRQQLEAAAAHGRTGRFGQRDARRLARQMRHELGLSELIQQIQGLLQALAQAGVAEDQIDQLAGELEANVQALQQQIEHHAALHMSQSRAEFEPQAPQPNSLRQRPFQQLSEREAETMRHEVARLARRLRTRLALRQKRGKGRKLDAKATLRRSLRTGGVPFDLVRRTRRRRARFTLICDVSTSMRPVVSFLLLLMVQIHSQVGRTRSFAFIDRIHEISRDLTRGQPEITVPAVLRRIPPGHYNTDLGRSLQQFKREFSGAVDRRTTVVFCGDGRNNYNDPRLDLMEWVGRRARHVVWFNPEPPARWGHGDSDMPSYAPLADAVFQVSNLDQLSAAVDDILL